jgi:hypothetical protein
MADFNLHDFSRARTLWGMRGAFSTVISPTRPVRQIVAWRDPAPDSEPEQMA